MKIKATTEYRDNELHRWVLPGETLTVSAERGQEIIDAGYAEIIEKKEEFPLWQTQESKIEE